MTAESFDPLLFLQRHGLNTESGVRAEPLAGGYLNTVFRVHGVNIDWVVKRFAPSAALTLFPNLPQAEYLALERLSKLGAAPQPVGYFDQDSMAPVLVYEFYAGTPWDGGMAEVAALLRRMAQAGTDGFRTVPTQPAAILAQGDGFLPICPAAIQARFAALRPALIDLPEARLGVLHTDFGPGNLISGSRGLRAIDWQCPAVGDPAEDVAAFLSPAFQILYGRAPLSEADEADFLSAYGDADGIARLHFLRPYFDWRMGAYCAMRAEQLAQERPTAAARYRAATQALLVRLEARPR